MITLQIMAQNTQEEITITSNWTYPPVDSTTNFLTAGLPLEMNASYKMIFVPCRLIIFSQKNFSEGK